MAPGAGDGGALTLVVTSPRTPAGLLSWPAWQALHGGTVLTASADHPQAPFLADAGIVVTVVERSDGDAALAARLHDRAVAGERLVWLADGEADAGLVRALAARSARAAQLALEVVHGSYDLPGSGLLDVVAVVDRLRGPDGCPWDGAQTHDSLKRYLLEEAYEAYEALETGDLPALREELGDVLLQVVLHARLAQEGDRPWSVDDVAADLVAKLVRRHPHVFAGAPADDLEGSWERLKAAEGRTSPVAGVPMGQPALALASALQRRAARAGTEVPSYPGSGGALWELVARCRDEGLDPEAELRAVARRFRDSLRDGSGGDGPDGTRAAGAGTLDG